MRSIPPFLSSGARALLPKSVRHWPFWTLNGPAKSFLVVVELLAVVLTAVAATQTAVSAGELGQLALLGGLATGYAEAADRIERFKRFLGSDRVWSNHTSVWAFGAALLLPAGYAAMLVVLLYTHVLFLGRRHQSVRPYRLVFTASTMTLATLAASAVVHEISSAMPLGNGLAAALGIMVAICLFQAVNLGVLLMGMAVATRPERPSAMLPKRDVVGFETITNVLGVVTAEFVLHTVWLAPVVLVLVAALHRSSLVKELQVAATTDLKTGLLNAVTWRARAKQGLTDAGSGQLPVAMILVDLDFFKRINDAHGHLIGDQVLVEVADTLRREIRDDDILGRFGGEEFALFLPQTTLVAASAVADRLRARIAAVAISGGVSVTASIGLAHTLLPRDVRLDELIASADAAMYKAKAGGRDRVCTTLVRPALAS